MAQQFTLGKHERLKSRKLIERIFLEGKKFSIAPFRISWLLNVEGSGGLQVGVGVSSRNFKRAVDRNRIKRLMREAWRLQNNELKSELANNDTEMLVFINFSGKELPEYSTVTEAMKKITGQLVKLSGK